ncbi:zinc metallopeptidase [Peptococcus simiae]|uniref:Zinc metallopeptidase n=1 Tax=Peptococcus simiae TaxID=1643805 RepID=A0ABW9GZ13_9FIRM
MYFDPTFLLLIPCLILGIYAQSKVSSTYRKYNDIANMQGYTGLDVARKMLDDNGLYDVTISQIGGELSDHYDPREKEVRLSYDVYYGNSISAVGIAAHEVGHAIQHAKGYFPLRIRNTVIPITNFGSFLYLPLIILGIVLSAAPLIKWGIIFFSLIVFFQVITLPVEFNASRRAIATLGGENILNQGELAGAKSVLGAAALTYVAAAVTAIFQLLRLILIFGGGRSD